MGASSAPIVFGVDEYGRSAMDLWATLLGVLPPEPEVIGDARDCGTKLERPILERLYARKCGITEFRYPGTMLHPNEKWMGATPDAIVRRDGKAIGCQVKCVGRFAASKWGDVEQGADGVPPGVLIQTHHEMAVAGLEACDVVALVCSTDLRVYRVERNEKMIEGMIDVEREWWQKHIVHRERPEPMAGDSEVLRKLIGPERLPVRQATEAEKLLARDYDLARKAMKQGEVRKELAAARLQALMDTAAGIEWGDIDGGGYVTWKTNKSGATDWKKLALELLANFVPDSAKAAEIIALAERPAPRVMRVSEFDK